VVGHVVHDLRTSDESLADRDAARALADRLGLPFAEAAVQVRGRAGNFEAAARRARYAALTDMAAVHGCRFIATAHHADDQLETMLMALLRGAGPRGLAGVAVKRKQRAIGRGASGDGPGGLWVIRPMLGDESGRVPASTRADAEAICRLAGWAWRVDASNADTRLLRNALRREVLPVLEALRPGASLRASRCASLLRDSAQVVHLAAVAHWDERKTEHPSGILTWSRAALRPSSSIVLGELLRLCATRLASVPPRAAGDARLDRLSRSALAPVIRAIRDASTDPREFAVGPIRVRVTARQVRVAIAAA
jgi:tRNA(Ile)-lysidine synthase